MSIKTAFTSDHSRYRPDIDGLCALAVLGFHAFPQWLRGGFVGVDVFFVISGFLITGILLGHLRRGDFSFGAFYAARVRRIVPALLPVFLACLVFGWIVLLPDEYVQLGKHVAGGAGFVANLLLWQEAGYFDTASQYKPLLHLWSLGVEEQFYLLWPVLLWAAFRWQRSLGVLLLLVGGGSLIANLLCGNHHFQVADFYSPALRLWELMAGAALSFWAAGKKPAPLSSPHPDWGHLASILGLALIITAAFLFKEGQVYPSWRGLLPVVGAALLIAAGPEAVANRWVLGNKLLIGIGLISYPLYLWHWPLLSFATIILAQPPEPATAACLLAASFVLAGLTYRLVERPIRFGPRRRYAVPALCSLLVAAAVAGGLLIVDQGARSRPVAVRDGNERFDVHEDVKAMPPLPMTECKLSEDLIPPKMKGDCAQFGSNDAKHTLVVWGDSFAGAWGPVFYTIGHDLGDWRVVTLSFGGCPPIEGIRQSFYNPDCDDINQGTHVMKIIEALHPSHVVLVSLWERALWGPPHPYGVANCGPECGRIVDNVHDKASMETSKTVMARKLPETVAKLARKSKVIIMLDTPLPKMAVNEASVRRLPWIAAPTKSPEQPLTEHLARTAFTSQLIRQIAAQTPNVTVFDPTPYFCDDSICHVKRNGVIMYGDNTHISTSGAMSFKPYLLPLFATP